LAELLSAISEAPDFVTAATFLLAQFADIVGARRALAITLDTPPNRFVSTATVGFEDEDPPAISIRSDDLSNPLAVAALSLHPVSCEQASPSPGLPFSEWSAIPFPQPLFRGAPSLLNELDARAPGLAAWDAELFRARGMPPGRWSLAHETGRFHLVAGAGDRALGEVERLTA